MSITTVIASARPDLVPPGKRVEIPWRGGEASLILCSGRAIRGRSTRTAFHKNKLHATNPAQSTGWGRLPACGPADGPRCRSTGRAGAGHCYRFAHRAAGLRFSEPDSLGDRGAVPAERLQYRRSRPQHAASVRAGLHEHVEQSRQWRTSQCQPARSWYDFGRWCSSMASG